MDEYEIREQVETIIDQIKSDPEFPKPAVPILEALGMLATGVLVNQTRIADALELQAENGKTLVAELEGVQDRLQAIADQMGSIEVTAK